MHAVFEFSAATVATLFCKLCVFAACGAEPHLTLDFKALNCQQDLVIVTTTVKSIASFESVFAKLPLSSPVL